MAAAYSLARAGWREITIIESSNELGGLAGTFRHGEHFYPLAYHHILRRDRTLLYFLQLIGALDRVDWRKIRMLFRVGGALYDLSAPADFLRFPMSVADKLRFVRLMVRCFLKEEWGDWQGRHAAGLVDAWGGPGVRRAIFEPLTRLKFDLACREVSAAWLGARLHFREGSDALGYIPGCNWTKVLCDGLARLLIDAGVSVRLGTSVRSAVARGKRIVEVELDDGQRSAADLFVSTLPTEVYRGLAADDRTAELAAIRYTAVVSALFVTRQKLAPDFYWMNLASPTCSACGLFRLESLNPTIGAPGETCLNFVTHLPDRDHEFFRRSDESLTTGFLADFRQIFGFELEAVWSRLLRRPMYSPRFVTGYRNPPVRSTTYENVYFAGNYRTFPSIATTGTALGSGLLAGETILADHGQTSELTHAATAFRYRCSAVAPRRAFRASIV